VHVKLDYDVVVNHSDELGAVLIVDVLRPLLLAADLVNCLLVDVVARHTYGRALARKADELARTPLARQRAAA
jgi:hypothetical protein